MNDETTHAEVTALYQQLLQTWNQRDAVAMAALFAEDGSLVGFDGSPLDGRATIESHIRDVFEHHQTAAYIGKVREVRQLAPDVALLRAVSGMIPVGANDINPAVNTIHALVAVRQNGQWRVAHYQNTPAAFHGRPDDVAALSAELRDLLKTDPNFA